MFSIVKGNDNPMILVVFEGSDWCSNCRKFEQEVLQDSLVIAYLREKDIQVIKVDFPQKKKLTKEQKERNKKYAERYNFQGVFPTVILSRTDRLRYKSVYSRNITPSRFIQDIKGTHLEYK